VVNNHDQKFKDMIESVLPSTARKSARDRRRQVHKRSRARQRIALDAIKTSSYDETAVDFRDGRRKSELKWMVLDRRGADNVGALTRWAAAVVEADPRLRDAPLHVQVAHFAGILPADVIGRHAIAHIEWALIYRAERPYWSQRREQWVARADERKREMVDALDRVLAAGRHDDLNRALRWAYTGQSATDPASVEARYLLGQHDIHAFAEATARVEWICEIVARVARS
jgi:hypothetical protein